jgi:hypothetical protein
MQRSHVRAANYVMKLHASVLLDVPPEVALYPVIDGVYLVSENELSLRSAIVETMFRLGTNFIFEQEHFRFLVRGAVAFGPVILGEELTGNSHVLMKHREYCNRVVLGMPLTQAYFAERSASPYGIFVHESARAFSAPQARWLRTVHFRWWQLDDDENQDHQRVASHLKRRIDDHLAWCLDHSSELLYEPERIRVHRELARQYFSHEGKRPVRVPRAAT